MGPATVLPDAAALLAILHIDALAMLLPVLPLTVVAAAIGPREGAEAVLLVLFVVADVSTAVWPGEVSTTLHFGVDPGAVVGATVGPGIHADAVELIVEEVTFVAALVGPDEFALAGFLAFFVVTGVH